MRMILLERARYNETEPPQDPALVRCVKAYRDLVGERQIVPGGIASIPYRAVMQWAADEGLDHEAARIVFDVLQRVENERLRLEAAKAALAGARGGNRS